MSADPYAGYVGHPVDIVEKALAVIMPRFVVETVKDGTNPSPGMKPTRLRVFYSESTKKVSRVVVG